MCERVVLPTGGDDQLRRGRFVQDIQRATLVFAGGGKPWLVQLLPSVLGRWHKVGSGLSGGGGVQRH